MIHPQRWPEWAFVEESIYDGRFRVEIQHGDRKLTYFTAAFLRDTYDWPSVIWALINHGKQRLIAEQATVDAVAKAMLSPPDSSRK